MSFACRSLTRISRRPHRSLDAHRFAATLDQSYPAGEIVNIGILVGTVLVLMNLERTFRAAVGTMQWRIKFLVLGLAVIFGARIYTRSQALVFSGHNNSLGEVEAIGLLVGCALLSVGYFRSGFREIDVYPSRAVLHTSITVLLVGGYLFVIGMLAQIVEHYGGASSFQFQAFLILIAIALLAVLLLSEKIRQRIRQFVSRHFSRPQYDFRRSGLDSPIQRPARLTIPPCARRRPS